MIAYGDVYEPLDFTVAMSMRLINVLAAGVVACLRLLAVVVLACAAVSSYIDRLTSAPTLSMS